MALTKSNLDSLTLKDVYRNTTFEYADLRDADLKDADLSFADLKNINWLERVAPDAIRKITA